MRRGRALCPRKSSSCPVAAVAQSPRQCVKARVECIFDVREPYQPPSPASSRANLGDATLAQYVARSSLADSELTAAAVLPCSRSASRPSSGETLPPPGWSIVSLPCARRSTILRLQAYCVIARRRSTDPPTARRHRPGRFHFLPSAGRPHVNVTSESLTLCPFSDRVTGIVHAG
jgi:hypothetical protein